LVSVESGFLCVCVCVCVCARACVCVCVCVRARALYNTENGPLSQPHTGHCNHFVPCFHTKNHIYFESVHLLYWDLVIITGDGCWMVEHVPCIYFVIILNQNLSMLCCHRILTKYVTAPLSSSSSANFGSLTFDWIL
jgi:hypothetical protein